MEEDPVSKYLSQIGRKGGQSRAKRLTPEQRKEIGIKGGKASGKVRKKKAKRK
jgi:general stress protein YciG